MHPTHLLRFLRLSPEGAAVGGVAVPVAPVAPAAPVDPATLNNGTGDAPTDRVLPAEDGAPSSIADASRAFRERIEQRALEADAASAARGEPAPPAGEQPRNPDGTFAPKDPVPAAPADGEQPAAEAAPAEGAEGEGEGEEPQVFVLKGEAQRGEPDIEIDITGLPPEVVERLERAQKQGLRRAEFDQAMRKVRTDRADLDAVETEIAVDATGFVLNRVPLAKRTELAAALLFEQWDALAPTIQQFWEDAAGRRATLLEIQSGVTERRTNVATQVQASREAAAVKASIVDLVPETVDDALGQEFFETAIALLQSRAARGERVTADTVSHLLADHRRRYFGAESGQPASPPPARPKLAVRSAPSPRSAPAASAAPAAPAPPSPVPARSPAQHAQALQARHAALAVAPVGAGAAAVQRPGGPPNETIEEASHRLRGQKPRHA